MKTPVVLIVFKRPDPTRRVLAAIREARPPMLFVVADGPRNENGDDAVRCAEVRALIDAGVDWPCEVVRLYSDVNLGCARRVSSGLDAVFARVEEAIILEDDCLPDPSFFPFCEEMLARYRDETQVAQVAGCSFQKPAVASRRPSYYFSRYPHCWGWATWRRAWRHYDHEMTAWREEGGRAWLDRAFEHAAERRWWAGSFDATVAGRFDSWAFRWTATVLSRQWLGVLPYRNLVSNIGFGPDATHTHEAGGALGIPVCPLDFPLKHPANMRRDARADSYTSRRLFRPPGLGRRLVARLHRLCSR